MQIAKFIAFITTMIATMMTWLLMGMALFLGQSDGVFWYGLMGVALGTMLKLETRANWF